MDGLTVSILGKDFSTLASIPVSAYADYGSDSTLVNGYYEEMDTSLDFVIPLDDDWKPPGLAFELIALGESANLNLEKLHIPLSNGSDSFLFIFKLLQLHSS